MCKARSWRCHPKGKRNVVRFGIRIASQLWEQLSKFGITATPQVYKKRWIEYLLKIFSQITTHSPVLWIIGREFQTGELKLPLFVNRGRKGGTIMMVSVTAKNPAVANYVAMWPANCGTGARPGQTRTAGNPIWAQSGRMPLSCWKFKWTTSLSGRLNDYVKS